MIFENRQQLIECITLLVQIDGLAELRVQFDLELLHLQFAFICLDSKDRHLSVDDRLILFKALERAGLRHVNKSLSDFVSGEKLNIVNGMM